MRLAPAGEVAKPLRVLDDGPMTIDGKGATMKEVVARLIQRNPDIEADDGTRAVGRNMPPERLPHAEDVELFDQQYSSSSMLDLLS